jgi:hypothetical protein
MMKMILSMKLNLLLPRHRGLVHPKPQDDLDLPKVATTIDFNLDGPPTSTPEGEGTASTTSTYQHYHERDRQPEDLALLLMYHHQYGHIFNEETPGDGQTAHNPETTGIMSGADMLGMPLL